MEIQSTNKTVSPEYATRLHHGTFSVYAQIIYFSTKIFTELPLKNIKLWKTRKKGYPPPYVYKSRFFGGVKNSVFWWFSRLHGRRPQKWGFQKRAKNGVTPPNFWPTQSQNPYEIHFLSQNPASDIFFSSTRPSTLFLNPFSDIEKYLRPPFFERKSALFWHFGDFKIDTLFDITHFLRGGGGSGLQN